MTVLLDTCSFIWMSVDPTRLSAPASPVLADPSTRRLFSSISALEMAIKVRLGKLTLRAPLDQLVQEGLRRGVIEELPPTIDHSLAVVGLPLHPRDPFDRVLVAQSKVENIPVITNDPEIGKYGVPIIW